MGSFNFVSLEKFTRAHLFQIALEIIWLPILIYQLYLQHWLYLNNEDQLKSHHNTTFNINTNIHPQLAYQYTLA